MNRLVCPLHVDMRVIRRYPAVYKLNGYRLPQSGYVNCIINDIRKLSSVSHAVNKEWSYCRFRQVKKELNVLSNLLQGSRLLWKSSTTLYTDQRRHYSNERNEKKTDEEDNKKDKDKDNFKEYMRAAEISYAVMFAISGAYLLATISPDIEGWAGFEKQLLSKGLVRKGVVYNGVDPTKEIVHIYTHPEATYNGRPTPTRGYHIMSCPKGFFEKQVQEFEAKNGITAFDKLSLDHSNSKPPQAYLLTAWTITATIFAAFMLAKYTMRANLPKSGASKDSPTKMPNSMSDLFTDMIKEPMKLKIKRGDKMIENLTFKDVAGLHEAKVEILEFVDYIKKPDRFKRLGASVPKGVLLLGPPGCGKTLLAKALAAEAKVPFFAHAGTDFVEMVGGLGASRVRELFKNAREQRPCIIYIDEVDAIGSKRSQGSEMSNGEEEQTLNQLLVEMDGMGTIEGVLILASTNRSDVLDKALLRAGRFDRHILVDIPTVIERIELFEIYLSKLKLEHPISAYAVTLAQRTPGMSGADIANVCNEAAIHAARSQKKMVTAADFNYAIERIIAGAAKANSLSAVEKNITAYHESGHALMEWLSPSKQKLLKVSIVPRTSAKLGFSQYTQSDLFLKTKEDLFEMMCNLLGGRVAESIVFNKVTTGSVDDLKKVTRIANEMIGKFGMNETVGQVSFPSDEELQSGFSRRPYSKQLKNIMDEECRKLVSEAYLQTEEILKDNMDKLHKLANALLEKESLDYAEVESLIGPPPHEKHHEIHDPAKFFASK